MTHTPGPWHTNTFDTVISTREDKRTETIVARCRLVTGRQKEAIANARLIAAAPALLEACKSYQRIGQHIHSCTICGTGTACAQYSDLVLEADHLTGIAIAQAEADQ